MNPYVNYSAIGILGVMVLAVVPFLIRWLVGHIDNQSQRMDELTREFRQTIDNHVDHLSQAEIGRAHV